MKDFLGHLETANPDLMVGSYYLEKVRGRVRGISKIVGALESPEKWKRLLAATALLKEAERNPKGNLPVPALEKAVHDPYYGVALDASQALARLGNKAGLEVALASADKKHSRQQAFRVLGLIASIAGDLRARAKLLSSLSSSNPDARRYAAEALGSLKDGGVVRALVGAIESDALTAYDAVKSLGAIKDPAAVPALMKALDHPSSEVRWAAWDALKSFGGKAKEDADRIMEPRVEAMEAMIDVLRPDLAKKQGPLRRPRSEPRRKPWEDN